MGTTRLGSTLVLRPRALSVLTLSALALSAVARAGNPPAIELGPAPIGQNVFAGRMSALAVSPTDANRYFAAAADGGVWRTTDAGATWTPLTDHMPTTAIGALALDPHDENVIYAGTGEANFANHSRYGLGLMRSTDGGDTWAFIDDGYFAGRTFSSLIVDPQNPLRLFAAIAPAGGFPALAAAKLHPQREGPLGVFRSDDGGFTWTHLTNGLPAVTCNSVVFDPADSQVLYAGIGDIFGHPANGVYKSIDGGQSWQLLTDGLPADPTIIGRVTLAVAPTNAQRVYAFIARSSTSTGGGASTRGLYISNDGGATWTRSQTLPNAQATYGWYLSVVAPHPTQPATVLVGGLSLYRTTDDGATWIEVTPPHVDIHAVAWDAAGRMLCGNDGGVHRSSNDGLIWTALNQTLGSIQFYAGLSTHPSDPDFLIGGAQDNGSNRITAATGAWSSVLGGDGGWTQVNPNNPNRVYAEFQGTGSLYRSINGGATFASIGTGLAGRNCFLPPYVLDPAAPQTIYYGSHQIYRSTNGGDSWQVRSPDLTNGPPGAIRSLAISPTNTAVLYAATNDGRILCSQDAALSFAVCQENVPGWPRVTRELFVSPQNAAEVYLAVAAFGPNLAQVQRSADFGQTWEPLDAGLPDIPVNTVVADVRFTPPVLYAGSDSGLYRSIDGGWTWTLWGDGLPRAAIIDLVMEPQRARLTVGTQGRGAWRVPLAAPGDLDTDQDVDLDDLLVLLGTFGCQAPWPDCAGDADGDGLVDLDDLLYVLGSFTVP